MIQKQHGGFRALDNHGFFTMKQGKVYLLPSAVYYIHRNDLQSVIFGPLSCKKILIIDNSIFILLLTCDKIVVISHFWTLEINDDLKNKDKVVSLGYFL